MPNFYNLLRARKFSTAADTAVEIAPYDSATPNFTIDAGGKLSWSSGSANADTNLYRSAANTLKTDDSFDLASGKTYKIDGADVVTATSLGSSVVSSSLTSLGTVQELSAATPSFTGPATFSGPVIFSETPTATTAASGTSTTQLATTEFVTSAITSRKIYVTKYTTNGSGTWTCPAGVTQIKLTLIGAGGGGGLATVSVNSNGQTASAVITGYEDGGSTTFVVGGTTYTALGGVAGTIDTTVDQGGTFGTRLSGSSSNSVVSFSAENRYPGSGGMGGFATATANATVEQDTGDFVVVTVTAKAYAGRGQDGVTEVFQVTTVPSTVYSFNVGMANGYTGTTLAKMGSNGAVIIEYVV
jgi:hypothetical protein